MPGSWLHALKHFILWDHPRGSFPYDIMCVLILAFIFLTPRDVFRDQPKPKNVVMIPGAGNATVFWIDSELLVGYSEKERPARAEAIIKHQAQGKNLMLARLEPIFDSEEEIKGFMAFAHP